KSGTLPKFVKRFGRKKKITCPPTPVPEAVPTPPQPVPPKVYRGGSATKKNLTPRPSQDPTGLSTSDNIESATPPGGKAHVIDTSKLKHPLQAFPDDPPGHVSLAPSDAELINPWAATRDLPGPPHPFTQ